MWVAVNMAMSIDGKIATKARGPVKLTSEYDTRRMAEIRAEHDAVINGASTFRAYPYPLVVKGEELVKQRVERGLTPQPISAVVSSDLNLPKGTPWEKAKDIERWVFCGKKSTSARKLALEKSGVKVYSSKAIRPSAQEILKAFQSRGCKKILLEGGGEFNASFFEKGLVDRIYLTVAPKLVGGAESPTFFEGMGMKKFPVFKLMDCEEIQGELYLIYDR